MKELKVKFENCFGIKKMEDEFDFSKSQTQLIYAKNGSMKTSFAKIFESYQNGKQVNIGDKIFEEPESYSIRGLVKDGENEKDWLGIKGNKNSSTDDPKDKNENIFVIHGLQEKHDWGNISNLLLNKDLKEDLKDILDSKDNIYKKLSKNSGLKNTKINKELENKIIEIFNFNDKSFLNNLKKLELKDYGYNKINFKDIFDNEDFIKTRDFQYNINDFIKKQAEVSDDYDFLKNSNLNFFGLKSVGEALKKEDFFCNSKINKIILGSLTIEDIGKSNIIIKEIEDKILDSDEFKTISKKLVTDKGKRLLKILQNNPEITEKLKLVNIENFKKEIFESYFFELKDDVKSLIKDFSDFKDKLPREMEKSNWEKAKNIFNDRFSMPFKMEIGNLNDSIFGSAIPLVEFHFCNKDDFEDCKDKDSGLAIINEDKILDTLSQGEKRALYLLNIIFDIENLKKEIAGDLEREILFIIDDIADSFDYKNKYAIVEYLRDLSEEENFYSIILTHNFDFFRFLSKRLKLEESNKFISIKKEEKIMLSSFSEDEPWKEWKKDLNEKNIIALIPFVRNLVEYGKNIKKDFLLLTYLLHIKQETFYDKDGKILKVNEHNKVIKGPEEDIEIVRDYGIDGDFEVKKTDEITFKDLLDIYKEYLGISNFNGDVILEDKVFEKVCSISLDESLEGKLIYGIKIRYVSEQFMINKINNNNFIYKISSSQTNELFQKLKGKVNARDITDISEDQIRILESVNIMTPENIHLNSFMYEPILDMDIGELKKLYEKVKDELKIDEE